MYSDKKVKIIVVDDHEFFRKGVILTISKFKYAEVTAEAVNGIDFLEKMNKTKADIALMDIKMPGMNGIEATKKALQKYPDLKIVALSMFGEEEYLESMIEAGVSGFLLKNVNREGLDYALRSIAEGKNYYSEELMPFFTKKYINKFNEDNQAKLTRRELEVLELVSQGYNNREIAEKLFISIRTVTNHRANLNMKTGSKNTVTLLSYAIKNNLVKMR